MGLDCYIVHGNDQDKAFTSKDSVLLEGINLCGGMFSGSGNDGSFRGKVYEPLIDELMEHDGEGIWHKSSDDDPPYVTSDELKEQAEALEELIKLKIECMKEDGETYDYDTIIHTTRCGGEYTYGEVKDLATLLGVAGKRGAVMHVWW